MAQYNTPHIEVLLFDEEDIVTTSGTEGYTATDANTFGIGRDAGMRSTGNVKISTVKINDLVLDSYELQ